MRRPLDQEQGFGVDEAQTNISGTLVVGHVVVCVRSCKKAFRVLEGGVFVSGLVSIAVCLQRRNVRFDSIPNRRETYRLQTMNRLRDVY